MTVSRFLCKPFFDLLSSHLGDEDSLNRLLVQPESLSRVDERGWIPLHEAAIQDDKKILEIIFSGISKVPLECFMRLQTHVC